MSRQMDKCDLIGKREHSSYTRKPCLTNLLDNVNNHMEKDVPVVQDSIAKDPTLSQTNLGKWLSSAVGRDYEVAFQKYKLAQVQSHADAPIEPHNLVRGYSAKSWGAQHHILLLIENKISVKSGQLWGNTAKR